MYLLMLLATFLSAIYGYNLSPRSDYDNDIAYKKAAGVMYKFLWQEDTIKKHLFRLYSKNAIGANDTMNGEVNMYGLRKNDLSPGDLFYGDGGAEGKLYIKHSDGTNEHIYMHFGKTNGNKNSANYLPPAQRFYTGKEMVSKYICLRPNELLDGNSAHFCTNTTDPSTGGITSYCCFQNGVHKYLVSYKKIDARFINRVHRSVSLEFYRTLNDRREKENIGIIRWNDTDDRWHFEGKIALSDIYQDEIEAWKADDSHYIVDEYGHRHLKEGFPTSMRKKSEWKMPEIFDEDFFKDKDGNNMCADGCLFRIRDLSN